MRITKKRIENSIYKNIWTESDYHRFNNIFGGFPADELNYDNLKAYLERDHLYFDWEFDAKITNYERMYWIFDFTEQKIKDVLTASVDACNNATIVADGSHIIINRHYFEHTAVAFSFVYVRVKTASLHFS